MHHDTGRTPAILLLVLLAAGATPSLAVESLKTLVDRIEALAKAEPVSLAAATLRSTAAILTKFYPDRARALTLHADGLVIREADALAPERQTPPGLEELLFEDAFALATALDDPLDRIAAARALLKQASTTVERDKLSRLWAEALQEWCVGRAGKNCPARYEALALHLSKFGIEPGDDPSLQSRNLLRQLPARVQQAHPFQLVSVTGETFEMHRLRGSVVLIDFWASWCIPCRAEFPVLKRLQLGYQASGLVILGITQESESVARAFSTGNSLPFPTLLDRRGTLQDRYEIASWPANILIDRQGNLVARYGALPPMGQLMEDLRKAGI